jgi:hypothetical protein
MLQNYEYLKFKKKKSGQDPLHKGISCEMVALVNLVVGNAKWTSRGLD